MITKQPLISIHKHTRGSQLFFNKSALDLIDAKEICIFYTNEGIIIKKPILDSKHTTKIYSSTCYFKSGDNDDLNGKYEIYRKDEDTFLLTKLN